MTTVFKLLTLVDITATGVIRSNGDRDLERNQQRNFETLLQVLGIRTQPHIIRFPEYHDVDPEDPSIWFGDFYHNQPHRLWSFYFTADVPTAYAQDGNPVGMLLKDFEEVPIITGLTETAKFMLPIFYPHGTIKNIHINLVPNE